MKRFSGFGLLLMGASFGVVLGVLLAGSGWISFFGGAALAQTPTPSPTPVTVLPIFMSDCNGICPQEPISKAKPGRSKLLILLSNMSVNGGGTLLYPPGAKTAKKRKNHALDDTLVTVTMPETSDHPGIKQTLFFTQMADVQSGIVSCPMSDGEKKNPHALEHCPLILH